MIGARLREPGRLIGTSALDDVLVRVHCCPLVNDSSVSHAARCTARHGVRCCAVPSAASGSTKDELVEKKVVAKAPYDKVKDQIVAK